MACVIDCLFVNVCWLFTCWRVCGACVCRVLVARVDNILSTLGWWRPTLCSIDGWCCLLVWPLLFLWRATFKFRSYSISNLHVSTFGVSRRAVLGDGSHLHSLSTYEYCTFTVSNYADENAVCFACCPGSTSWKNDASVAWKQIFAQPVHQTESTGTDPTNSQATERPQPNQPTTGHKTKQPSFQLRRISITRQSISIQTSLRI
jgi:hypothetical protein